MSIPHGSVSAPAKSGAPSASKRLEELKLRVHRQLLERLDLVALSSLDSTQAEEHIRTTLQRLLLADSPELSGLERERLIEEVGYEVFGLGPLEEFLKDSEISDILVNGPGAVYVERQGRLSLTDVKFRDEEHLMKVIDRIVSTVGRRLDRDSPMVDARLPDGSRVNAIVAPLAVRGPCLSIRRFGRDPYRIDMLQAMNTGHDGSLTTIHANSPRECLQRLEVMVLMAGYDLPVKAIRQQVGSAVNVLVQAARLTDGSRKIVRVSEIVGMESDQLQLQDIFEFVQTGVTPEARVHGQFRATGLRSRYFDRLVVAGVKPEDILPGAGER